MAYWSVRRERPHSWAALVKVYVIGMYFLPSSVDSVQSLAYSGSDMQMQHYVNAIGEGGWPRGQEVCLRDGQLCCLRTPDKRYDLVEAYARSPHLQFLKCATDDQLVAFVKTWGPLSLAPQEWSVPGLSSLSVNSYRVFQRWLKAVVKLIDAFKNSANEREWLQEFLAAEFALSQDSAVRNPGNESSLESYLKAIFRIAENAATWIKDSDLNIVRAATELAIGSTTFLNGQTSLAPRKTGNLL